MHLVEDDGRALRIPPYLDEGNTRQLGRGNRMEYGKGRRTTVSLRLSLFRSYLVVSGSHVILDSALGRLP